MSLTFEIAGAQIDGAREYQEDSFLVSHLVDSKGQPSSLVIVADGMGGHAAGNIASNLAVQSFNKVVTANYPADSVSQVLHDAVLKANHSIAETIKETPALDGMGCTLVGVLVEDNKLWWASVGDSNLYLLRNRELTKLNADHSYGGFLDAMAAAGTPVEPEPGLARNMLMSALTGGDISDIDCPTTSMQIKAGDKLLICSDGINTLSDGKIIQYCDWSDTSKECTEALLTAVEDAEAPKQDNATVIVVFVIDKAAAATVSPPPAVTVSEAEDITDPHRGIHAAPAAGSEAGAPAEPVQHTAPAEPVQHTAPVQAAEQVPAPPDKNKKIALMSIAAGVLIAAALGAYLLMSGGEAPGPAPEVAAPAEEMPAAEETTATETTLAEEASVSAAAPPPAAETAEVETPAAEPPATETAPAPEPATVTKGEEFRDTLKSGGEGPLMVWIPAGTYAMGSPATSIVKDERPRHNVTIKKFAISKFEVTIADYAKYAKAAKKPMPDDLQMEHETSPVVFVRWDDAYNYSKWLSEQTGHKYRLPSEAEWEYAASGGQGTTFWWGIEETPGMAHCFTCESRLDPRTPANIGTFKPNQFGLYDTAGNVSEWVYDCWHDSYDGAPADGSVWEGGDCSLRVARGGSYISPQQSIRTAKRDKFKSDSGYDHVGFRLVREE